VRVHKCTDAYCPVKSDFPEKKDSSDGEFKMTKYIVFLWIGLTFLLFHAPNAYAVDIFNRADQSTLRCRGGVVATGDSDRVVRQKCGEPLDVQRIQDYGPIWIYNIGQSKFLYYLAFQFGNLQRIVSAPCSVNDIECYDLR
jgi:hypothetical protein